MLTTAVDKPFSSKDWLFELKLDGYRAIAEISKGKLLLYSRNGLNMLSRYPAIAAALEKIKTEVILDGEIVLLDESGKPDFQKLQNYPENKQYPLVYYVFDILSFHKKDLKTIPLLERKKLLKKLLKRSASIRYCDHIEENGIGFFKKIKEDNLEGIIAKKKDSLYTPDIRTKEWLKIKNHKSQEAIIVGFTAPKRSRQHFGSLLLAQYKRGKLQYIGHAGTGFTDKTLKELMQKMQPLITAKSPFKENIKTNGPVTWVKPVLVCEIGYYEITQNGILRHPVYKGLRMDKKSKMIKAETERALAVKKIIDH
jgi:bifunctional non-homologous end joining protein LigD